MSDDITTRLRRDCMSLIADEAADTIDRLRAELCTAWEQAERWKDERDEARRIAAYQYAKHHNGDEDTLVRNFFEFRGWDCFKEDGK